MQHHLQHNTRVRSMHRAVVFSHCGNPAHLPRSLVCSSSRPVHLPCEGSPYAFGRRRGESLSHQAGSEVCESVAATKLTARCVKAKSTGLALFLSSLSLSAEALGKRLGVTTA